MDEEIIGNGDLRYTEDSGGGFVNVVLRDADDGDVIVIGEDDLLPLWNRLGKTLVDRGFIKPNREETCSS